MRQLIAGSVSLAFEIQSASKEASQVTALKSNLVAAATEGSLVANVQKQALDNGVLIAALRDMSRALPEPTVTDGTTSVTIITQVRPNEPDDSVGTTKETEDGVVSDGAKAGAAIGAVVALLGLAFLAKKFISKPKTEGTPDADAAVVRKGDLDNTLEVRTDSTV